MGHGKPCDLVDCLLSPLRLLKDRPVSLAPHSRKHPLVALDRAEVSVYFSFGRRVCGLRLK